MLQRDRQPPQRRLFVFVAVRETLIQATVSSHSGYDYNLGEIGDILHFNKRSSRE